LAKKYNNNDMDPTGWWISEKLDGVRAYWDPNTRELYSRLGNIFTAPAWFKDQLPDDISLDGELFLARGKFSATISIIKTVNSNKRWTPVEYRLFDAPSLSTLKFEDRMSRLRDRFDDKTKNPNVKVVEHIKCKDAQHIVTLLKEIENKGGEGLMLRKPKSLYEGRRSDTLLKVKSFYDAEAIVIGHEAGSGKNSRVMGALRVRMANGVEFKVGTGFTDKQRAKPPKIGAIITYRFQELSATGHPRFPSYVERELMLTSRVTL